MRNTNLPPSEHRFPTRETKEIARTELAGTVRNAELTRISVAAVVRAELAFNGRAEGICSVSRIALGKHELGERRFFHFAVPSGALAP
jgi:hypothetical protein